MCESNAVTADGPGEGPVLTKAVVRAAEILGLTAKVLGRALGVSEASVSRMKRGDFVLDPDTKPFQLGVLLVRLFRSLDTIAGGDTDVAQAWLGNANTVLGARPVEKIQTVTGLIDVIGYLDARCALV